MSLLERRIRKLEQSHGGGAIREGIEITSDDIREALLILMREGIVITSDDIRLANGVGDLLGAGGCHEIVPKA